ncbi:subtilisin family serine protease [Isoptericola jiangsuensis]|uniref:Subtilisin family serine protease n=1 Tax=Isoptericola jiangsuensis TaxID=548579 RepID=A0A2A9ET88_9MICO|nr:S8 family serine peptidase [Isoptericola jiangsuensis]PFG41445.1 subtilisin family serine protease [Isoptericola jiangsuensis]
MSRPPSARLQRSLAAAGAVAAVAATSFVLPSSAADDPDLGVPGDALFSTAGRADDAATGPTTTPVTLVTGDTVLLTVAADGSPTVAVPGDVEVVTKRVGDDLYVYPTSVLDAVRDDRLDPELFNVTGLVAQGYGDTERDDLPLIVSGAVPASRAAGVTSTAELESIGATAVTVDKDGAGALLGRLLGTARSAGTAQKVWLDAMVPALDDPTSDLVTSTSVPAATALDPGTGVEQTGAPLAWDRGLTGAGVTVAVLDSGYDATHPDLEGRVVGTADFTGRGMTDSGGHGTHVASTIAGTGAADPSRVGMAPDADLLVGHVLNDTGGQLSWIVDGMEWAVESGADVVNMSLGSRDSSDCTDPLSLAAQELTTTSDTLFVVAAGNDGSARSTVASPACVEGVLTVAAVDADGATAPFSSRGATVGEHRVKPDVAAPGVQVVGAWATSPGGVRYRAMSGTSMASPHVAGAAAMVRQAHPGWTAAQVKAAITAGVKDERADGVYAQGAGELWVPGAVDAEVTTPSGVLLGAFDWPHGRDQRTTTSVTYTNGSDEDVRVSVAVADLLGADGGTVPSSLVQVDHRPVVVPAGGSVDVPVSVRPDLPLRDDAYGEIGARLVATVTDAAGSRSTVTTAVGAWVEPETVEVTFRVLDGLGEPATRGVLDVTDLHQPTRSYTPLTGTDQTLALRAGEHSVAALVRTDDADGAEWASISVPSAILDRDRTVVLDARDAVPVTVEADRPLDLTSGSLVAQRTWDDTWIVETAVRANGTTFAVAPTAAVRRGTFTQATFLRGLEPGTPEADSPYVYNLAFVEEGRVGTDQARTAHDADLATVTEHWYAQRDGWRAVEVAQVVPAQGGIVTVSGTGAINTPTTRTAYYSPDVPWRQSASSTTRMAETWTDPVRTYGAGEQRSTDWFKLPTSTALPADASGAPGRVAERQGTLVGFAFPHWQDTVDGRFGEAGFRDVGNVQVWVDGVYRGASAFPRAQLTVAPGSHEIRMLLTQLRWGRGDTWELGTGAMTTFRFVSDQPDGDEVAALPVAIPRYDADVDDHNRAPAEDGFPVAVELHGQDGYDPGAVVQMSAQFTFEKIDVRGSKAPSEYTWTDARVERRDGRWVVLVDNAGRSGETVSLHVSTTDEHGSAVDQYLIDLYAVG